MMIYADKYNFVIDRKKAYLQYNKTLTRDNRPIEIGPVLQNSWPMILI